MNEVVIPLKIQGIAQMKAELRELKGAIASATDPAQMAALAEQAGVLSDKIKDANDAVNVFATGSKFEQVSNGLGGIKNSLMSLDFEEAAEKSKTFATALGGIGKADIGKAIGGITSMIGTLSKAFIKLGITILMNPIFLIVAAVVAIIAVIALVLKSFGVLDDVIAALMAPINALIAGFKAMTDWLGLTSFAAEDNAAKTLAANEKVTASSNERTARLTADLGREIAEAKAAGKDTTKLEEELSNVKIKEANNRKKTAKEALDGQKALGDKADLKKIEDLRKQIIAENEIIKQGYSDKKIAKLNDIKADADADATAAKEAAARAKQYASDRLNARREIRKQEIGLAGSDMEQERLTIINDHKVKLEDIKNNAALTKAEKIRLQELENQLFEEKKTDFTAKQRAIDKENKDKKKEADAKAITDAIAAEDFRYNEIQRLTTSAAEFEKLQAQQAFETKTAGLKENDQLYLLYKAEYQKKLDDIDTAAVEKVKSDEAKKRAEQFATIQKGFEFAQKTLGAIEGITSLAQANKLKGVEKGSKEEEKIMRKQFQINKSMQLAGAIIDAGKAITASLASSPIAIGPVPNPAGIASLAFASITAATNIAKIASTQFTSSTTPSTDTPPPSTTAVAPASGPSLFGNANTGSQVNAGGGSNNITVTAIVSETEITASQNHINNIQQNSVL
jgi:hypothetical protein